MQFQYQAKSKQGQVSSGFIEAATLNDARRDLRVQGLFPLSVTQRQSKNAFGSLSNSPSKKSVKKVEILLFTTQLTIMCQSGIDLAEALQTSASQCRSPVLKSVLEQVHSDVSGGQPVSVAMSKHEHVFGNAYIASIAAGEASGTLVEILLRLSELLRNEIRLRNTIVSVLSYPIVLMSVALLVVMALIFFVLPQFAIVFRDLGKTPPPMTQMILAVGSTIREYCLYLMISGGAGLFAAYRFSKTEYALKLRDRVMLNGFGIRNATRPLLTGRTFRLLGTMLQSGIPLLEAIRLCRSSIKNLLYRRMYDVLEEEILNGKGIGVALSQFEFIPPGAAQMMMTAEQTGKLGEVSQSIGEFYEGNGEDSIRQIAKLLEPAIIVAMGGIVAFVMLSIMLPLLDVSSASS